MEFGSVGLTPADDSYFAVPTTELAVAIAYVVASRNSSELLGGRRPSVLPAK
jgi:hypothetical protein